MISQKSVFGRKLDVLITHRQEPETSQVPRPPCLYKMRRLRLPCRGSSGRYQCVMSKRTAAASRLDCLPPVPAFYQRWKDLHEGPAQQQKKRLGFVLELPTNC